MDDDALDRWHFDISVANLSIEVSGSANLYRLKCDNLDQLTSDDSPKIEFFPSDLPSSPRSDPTHSYHQSIAFHQSPSVIKTPLSTSPFASPIAVAIQHHSSPVLCCHQNQIRSCLSTTPSQTLTVSQAPSLPLQPTKHFQNRNSTYQDIIESNRCLCLVKKSDKPSTTAIQRENTFRYYFQFTE